MLVIGQKHQRGGKGEGVWGVCRQKVPRCLSVSEQSAVKIAIYILFKGLLPAVTE